jgi:hypothetical protein
MTDWQLIVKSLTTSGLLVAGLMSFLVGRRLSKQGQFYSDVPKPLIGLGIFVWGDALILGPFWVISTMLLLLAEASILDILRYFLAFSGLRAIIEVIYWINHQVVRKQYQPPLFRGVAWINSEEAGILYQLLNTCVAFIYWVLLAATWLRPYKYYFSFLAF